MSGVFAAYAAYYDLLYRDKDYAGEARYVHGLLARHGVPAGRLLELGSGTGKHAQQLVSLGYSVRGVDASADMVGVAQRRVPAQLQTRLAFETADLRSVRLPAQFDAVIALFHVASYQSSNQDLAAMFATASAHLSPGGLFVFDFWYGPGVLTDPPAVRVRRLRDSEAAITRIAEPTMHADANLVDVHYTIFVQRHATQETFELEETHRMRYPFLPELQLMLEAAGMRILTAERWLSGALDLTSWQGVVVAGKLPHEDRRGRGHAGGVA
jgi:SAM-dependent methyltransferase